MCIRELPRKPESLPEMSKAITSNTISDKNKDLGEGGEPIMTGYHAKHSKEAYDCCRFKSALISSLGFNYPSISGAKRDSP